MLRIKKVLIYWIFLLLFSWTSSFAQEQPQQSEDLFLAKRAFGDGFDELALKHFQKYLQDTPTPGVEESEILIFIGRCYLNLGRFPDALHTLQQVLAQLPRSEFYDAAIYWTAQTYFAAKDYGTALSYFEKLIKNRESKFLAQSYYYRASCYYQSRKFNQALEAYQDFNQRFSKHQLKEKSHLRVAQCLYNVKDYSEARKKFKHFIKNFPQSAHINAAFYYLGEIEYLLGNFNKAVQYYTQAQEVQPEVKVAALAKYARGWAYLKLKRYQEALNEFNSLAESSDFGKSLEDAIIFARARCQAYLQNFEAAIQMYGRIINKYPHSSWFDDAYFWQGQALDELGKYSEACQTYEEAIEKFSQQAPEKVGERAQAIYEREDLSVNLLAHLRYNLGWTYARMKRYAEAITQFQQVFAESQERFLKSGALARIGDIHLEQKNITKAIEVYDLVLKDFPESYYADYAQYQLGLALTQEKRFVSAILAYNTLIANFPQSKFLDEAYYQLGAIDFRQGKFSQAQEKLEDLINEFPQSEFKPQAIFLKAFACYNEQDYLGAYEAFSQVLRTPTAARRLKMKAQYQIGFSLYQMEKKEKAIKEFKKFLALYPDSELTDDVLFWLGQYYFRQGKLTEAQEYFADLLQKSPRNELADDALFWQAQAFFTQGKLELALGALKNLQTDYPNSDLRADALLLTGDIFKDQGKIEQAKDLYKRISADFRESNFAKLAHKKSAELLKEQKDFSAAIAEYKSALGTSSNELNAQIQFAIAQCREAQEDYPQALDEYLKVGYLYPDASTWARKAQIKCAQIFERQAKWKKAKGIYERLAEEDSPEAEFARNRLKALNIK